MENKILSIFRKYFIKHKNEKFSHCLYCGKQLEGHQRKFCSDVCNGYYHRTKYKPRKNLANAKQRGKYMENIDGFKDKCLARNKTLKFRKLKGKCYLCGVRQAEDLHHPDYNKPELTYPLCRCCHSRHHNLLLLERRKN